MIVNYLEEGLTDIETGSLRLLINQLTYSIFEDFVPLPVRAARPAEWAQPLKMAGVPRLYQLTEHLFRSAEPTAEGLKNLKKAGIKTVVNLRAFHSNKDLVEKFGLAFDQIYVKTWHLLERDIVKFLRIATDSARFPILFHCHHGADRSGALCAIYRIILQGWTKKAAIAEMTEGGFGFHTCWVNLIPRIRRLNIDRIRRIAGL